MALNFPSSPSTGDVHNAANGLKYTYDGVKWTSQGAYSTGAIAPQKLDSIAGSFNGTLKTFDLKSGGTTVNAHSAESVLISIAGVVKEPTTDYTVNVAEGTITFTSAPTNGQAFWGIVYSRLPIDLQTNLAKTGGTMTGVITFDSSQTFDATKLSGTVATANIADDAINVNKIADNSIISAHLQANTIESSDIKDDAVGSAAIAENAVTNQHIADTTILHTNLANDCVTRAKLDANLVVQNDEVSGHTADNNTIYTTKAIDDNFYKLGSIAEIQSGETWSAADNKIATTSAIDARITDLVDDVGGFVPIANETSFPTANPDVNNGAGTLVSVKEFASSHTPSGGTVTIANGAGSGNTVTITGCGSTVLSAGYGGIVETTTTLHTYTFHRLTPKATEVTTVAGNTTNINTVAGNNTNINTVAGISANVTTVAGISSNVTSVAGNSSNINTVAGSIADVNAYADQYQIATSAPTADGGGNSLANGDLWFDSSSNKQMMVYDGSAGDGFSAVTPSQSVLNDIANVSGQLTYKEDLGSITDSLTTETGNNINTVATNINNINSFSDTYRVASSAPSSSLDEGDLWFDTTGNALKVYNGTTWVVTASAGMSELASDTTPELGGNLDCNNKNLTEVATVSGDNLQIDFGTIA